MVGPLGTDERREPDEADAAAPAASAPPPDDLDGSPRASLAGAPGLVEPAEPPAEADPEPALADELDPPRLPPFRVLRPRHRPAAGPVGEPGPADSDPGPEGEDGQLEPLLGGDLPPFR